MRKNLSGIEHAPDHFRHAQIGNGQVEGEVLGSLVGHERHFKPEGQFAKTDIDGKRNVGPHGADLHIRDSAAIGQNAVIHLKCNRAAAGCGGNAARRAFIRKSHREFRAFQRIATCDVKAGHEQCRRVIGVIAQRDHGVGVDLDAGCAALQVNLAAACGIGALKRVSQSVDTHFLCRCNGFADGHGGGTKEASHDRVDDQARDLLAVDDDLFQANADFGGVVGIGHFLGRARNDGAEIGVAEQKRDIDCFVIGPGVDLHGHLVGHDDGYGTVANFDEFQIANGQGNTAFVLGQGQAEGNVRNSERIANCLFRRGNIVSKAAEIAAPAFPDITRADFGERGG